MLDVRTGDRRGLFQSNGFLVRQALTDDSENKKKTLPLPAIAVFNPAIQSSDSQLSFRLFTGDLRGVRSALVSRLGWENSSFSNSILSSDARLLKFFKKRLRRSGFHWGTTWPRITRELDGELSLPFGCSGFAEK